MTTPGKFAAFTLALFALPAFAQTGHMGRNAALSDRKIFETVTLPWVVRTLER